MKKLSFYILLSSSLLGFSQDKTIMGVVVDAKSKEPIPFASIGIMDLNVGTVSNEAGMFRLEIPSQCFNDSLTISEVTHTRRKLPISNLLDSAEIVIELEEAITKLSTVIITPNKEKRVYEMVGVKPMFYWGSCYANFKEGAQIAHLMKSGSYPVFLSQARIKIGKNNSTKLKMRVRVLEKNKEGLPGQDVFEGAFLDVANMEGWVEVDLTYANLVFSEEFFVCFEFLNLQWEPTNGYFSIVCSETSAPSKNQLVRNTSFGKWEHALPGQNHIYAIGAEVYKSK